MLAKRILSWIVAALALLIAVLVVLVVCRRASGEEARRETRRDEKAAGVDDFDIEARAREIRAEEQARFESERGKVPDDDGDSVLDVLDAIDVLQPWYTQAVTERTMRQRHALKLRLAEAIADASVEHDIDPLIAVSMARRESSLHPTVGHGKKNGSLGERGYFQIFPDGYAERVCGIDDGVRCDQYDEDCNARTALCYLALLREKCGDDPWLYVGGYGRGRCPCDRAEAQEWAEVQIARDFYCEIADCDSGWPM